MNAILKGLTELLELKCKTDTPWDNEAYQTKQEEVIKQISESNLGEKSNIISSITNYMIHTAIAQIKKSETPAQAGGKRRPSTSKKGSKKSSRKALDGGKRRVSKKASKKMPKKGSRK